MITIRKTITVSDMQDGWIKRQIGGGGFTNDSEYIRDPVCRDQERQAKFAGLKQAIAEGLQSGVSERSIEDIWADGERRALTEAMKQCVSGRR